MKIIPVIDIQNRITVHAIRGKRSEYPPLKSILCSSSDPLTIALTFYTYGFHELYVADLDAITNRGSNVSILRKIVVDTQLDILVDAGISDLKKAQKFIALNIHKIIIGTESLHDIHFIKDAVKQFGKDRVVVSIDLKNGKILSASEEISAMDIFLLLYELQKMGVSQLIILDLAKVGSNEGVDFLLLKKILNCFKGNIFVGGGIRDLNELLKLKKIGVAGVLLATSLHSGVISIDSLRYEGLI